MNTPGGDHIAAFAADIDTFAKATSGVAHTSAIATKIAVASLAGFDRHRFREGAVFLLQFFSICSAHLAIDV
jgi:hypothetical protein